MTSSSGNIFRATGHLCGEFTGHIWIPRTKASDVELWCFLWSVPEKKRLRKQWWGWWFETPSRPLWRYCTTISCRATSLALWLKRKPPCIGGMELVSLSCNRVFISAESAGRGWCKIAIATKWYQFHTTDKCGFLFMPWITDQYTFVRSTTLLNKIGTAVAKVNTFSIMTT